MTFPFTKNRFVHVLVEQVGDVCLVERTNELTASVHWEVVILRQERPRLLASGSYSPSERYPSGNDWGRYGWTYTDLGEAHRKWASLCAASGQKGGPCAA